MQCSRPAVVDSRLVRRRCQTDEMSAPVVLRTRMFRGVIGGFGIGFAVVTFVAAVEADGSGANIRDRLLLAMFGVAGTLAVLRCTRLRLELDEWGLTVCHVVGTAKVAWTEIDRLTFRGQIPILVLREGCLLYTSPSPRDGLLSRMPSSA